MDSDSDDFGLDDTGDLAIDHGDDFAVKPRAGAGATRDSLFSDDDGDFDSGGGGRSLPPPQRPAAPAPPPRPSAPAPSRRHATSGDLFSEDAEEFSNDLELTAGDDSGDIEIDHAPAPVAHQRPAPPPPPPAHYTDPSMSLELDANDSELADLLNDKPQPPHHHQQHALRAASPLPPAPLPPPGRSVTPIVPAAAPQQPSAGASGSYGLDAEDSELAELLGEEGPAAKRPAAALPPPPPPPPAPAPPLAKKISFQEPPAAEPSGLGRPPPAAAARGPSMHRDARPAAAMPSDDFGDMDDEEGEGGYGIEDEADREVARIASLNSRRAQSVSSGNRAAPAHRSPAPQDSLADDFASEEEAYFDAPRQGLNRPPPPSPPLPGGGPPQATFRRVPQQGGGFREGYEDSYYEDSYVDSSLERNGRPPPRGIPPRNHGREPSGEYYSSQEMYGEDTYGDDGDMYDDRASPAAAFRRVPAPATHAPPHHAPPPPPAHPHRPPAPGPYDSGENQYEDDQYYSEDDGEDDFADDVSWDGEIRHSRGGYDGDRGRPSSAGHPRSRGPHAQGGRRRALSALPPRDRQAAILEDMMSRHPSTWDIREVATWVEFIGMGQYRSKFVHHSVDGTLLLALGEPELARELRILPLGHRRALLGAIAELHEAAEAAEKERAERGLPPGVPVQRARTEAERVAELRRRAALQEGPRRPAGAGAGVIPPEPYLGPALGKMTVYEQRAKLLYQLDRARHRAAQHAAIIEQLANNKALTEAQMAELRGKLKDLEAKHKDDLTAANRRPGMTLPLSSGGGAASAAADRHGGGAANAADAEYGADAAVPWQPVGRGTRLNPYPERFARRPGDDPELDLTFRPRTLRIQDVPAGAVRDIVAKALGSRVPFWRRMDYEFEKMRKEREAKEEARRLRRERLGMARRGGGGGGEEDEEQAKSKHWNNYWVPGSVKNSSYHKKFNRGSENAELAQYRSFAKDKTRLSRWFAKFVDDGEATEGDVVLERLVNRMIRALVKTKDQMAGEIGETFDKRVRRYFEERGYKFATTTSNTIMVRARGTRRPAPDRPDTTLYDFEQVEQYYPDYLKKKSAQDGDAGGGGDGGEEEETRMVPKRTTWKRLVAIYYMERQKKLRAAIAMVKMSQFVARHGPRWPPERDRDGSKSAAWVPSSSAGALHQVDGRDRTFNEVGRENISRQVKLKKALGPPQPKTFQMRVLEEEALEGKADALFAQLGWPHSAWEPGQGPPEEALLLPDEEEEEEQGLEGFGLETEGGRGGDGGGGGSDQRRRGRRRWAPVMEFFPALDALLGRALELRRLHDEWLEARQRAKARGYGEDQLSQQRPLVQELDWSGDLLMDMQQRAMERQRQQWLLAWEQKRRQRERRAERMRREGVREDVIQRELGRQQEAHEVEDAVRNHLYRFVTLLARYKERDLARFRDELKGTKKKMAVYRALCSQMFLDDTREKQQKREQALHAVYNSLAARTRGRRQLSAAQEGAVVDRLVGDARKRERRHRELVERQLEEEESSLTPWYMLAPSSRLGSRNPSPDPPTSPGPPARTRSPGAASAASQRPRSAPRTRGTSGGGGGALSSESSRGKYVFGSSTPKSMWGPVVRPKGAGTGAGGGGGLLDSPGLLGLTRSVTSLGGSPGRAAGSRGGGGGGGTTPARQRPATPTRNAGVRSGAAAGTAGGAAPTQRPASAAAPPSPRPSGGGSATAARAGRRPTSAAAAPPSPSSRPLSAAPAAAAAAGTRNSTGPPPTPQRSTGRLGATPTPPPQPPSAAGTRGRTAAPASTRPRRGLLDGDTTSGASASPSPERGPPRRVAAGAATAATTAVRPQRPSGTLTAESSLLSPQPSSQRVSQLSSPKASTTGGGTSSRRTSQGSVPATRAGPGAGPATPPPAAGQQRTAVGGAGAGAAAAAVAAGGAARMPSMGSGSGGSIPGSMRSSDPPSPLAAQRPLPSAVTPPRSPLSRSSVEMSPGGQSPLSRSPPAVSPARSGSLTPPAAASSGEIQYEDDFDGGVLHAGDDDDEF
ncbi:hypothetical protein Agub_g1775 [Astrephomene gubernaculifera]|uniref:SAM domain-containing protein n=1 Tax=Astrephomene gubernaculifera TaxID=47775 RepID=A0AAD3DIQ5_9CHLO|nr:hypothetical protein Agub_g1775 [Astrephomene gubernaculifera]